MGARPPARRRFGAALGRRYAFDPARTAEGDLSSSLVVLYPSLNDPYHLALSDEVNLGSPENKRDLPCPVTQHTVSDPRFGPVTAGDFASCIEPSDGGFDRSHSAGSEVRDECLRRGAHGPAIPMAAVNKNPCLRAPWATASQPLPRPGAPAREVAPPAPQCEGLSAPGRGGLARSSSHRTQGSRSNDGNRSAARPRTGKVAEAGSFFARAVWPGRVSARPPAWWDRIVVGDAIDLLRRLPEASTHLAITSPPYNVGIAYTDYADDRTYRGYLAWLREAWAALYRALVPGGRFALNVAPTSIKDFRPIHHDLARDLRELGFIMRSEVIWDKQTMGRRTAWGSWRSPSNPHIVPSWEYVLVFCKDRWKLDGPREGSDLGNREFERISDGFWAIPPERTRRGHPAPFPEELIERLVKFYSYRGQLVLDMFGGTGTVAAVSRRLGRHYLSFDQSLEYSRDAATRVRASTPPDGWPVAAPRGVDSTARFAGRLPASSGPFDTLGSATGRPGRNHLASRGRRSPTDTR